MTLEDHLGDIVRKGRMAAGVAPETAAKAAGITVAALAEMEESGKAPMGSNISALGKSIGMDGAKLDRIAKGWLPESVDLGQWRELRVFTSSGHGYTVNCFLVWDEVTKEAALFDTGWDVGPALELITKEGLQLKHFFLTH